MPKLIPIALICLICVVYVSHLRRRRRSSLLAISAAHDSSLLPGEKESSRVKRLRCVAPPEGSFATLLARMPAAQRSVISDRVAPSLQVMRNLVESAGVDVAECERRGYFAMLIDLYPNEMKGDFSMSDDRAIETVCTLMAAGVAAEKVVSAKDPSALRRTYPGDERSPVYQTVKKSVAMVTAYKAGYLVGKLERKD